MARTMADRIGTARRQSFVGRGPELELFDSLVGGDPDQGAVVFVHGAAGIGKTTLLRQFATRCQELGLTCLHLDARDLPPTPDALTARLSAVLDDEAPDKTRTVV